MDKRYYAFISYKREDLKEAEWLRNKLSHYHFPSKLRKENEALPKAIRPLFRDSLELAGGFLAKEIETALNESKYLIVICSPRSAKSPWVNKEVQHFIDIGREEYIIPYVIDGEPFSNDPEKECFPPALKSLQGEKELLGISTSELGKEAAAVKVVARMFGLRFDTLWQGYNRDQKKRRIAWGATAVFVLLLSVSVSALLYKNKNEISRQKQQIESQNKELIRKQDNLLINQSKYLASEAQKEYDKGNITKALRMALYALPRDLENPDRPYITEAERILRECDSPQKYKIYNRSIIWTGTDSDSPIISPNGKYVIILSKLKSISVWNVKTGKAVAGPLRHDDYLCSAVFSSCSKYIVTASEDKTARVWDARTGKPVTGPLRHNGVVWSAVFSPDGKYVATASSDSTARVWDAITGKPITEPLQHDDTVWSAVLSPDGKSVVTASDDGTARVWDAQTGKPKTEPLKHNHYLKSAVFSPDGEYILTASLDSTARVWNAKTGEPVTEPLKHEGYVFSAQFSPDGRYIVTASWDNTARVWDAKTGEPVTEPLKHEQDVESAQFSPNGKYIVTASADSTARIWDAQTGEPITEPLKHNNRVESALYNPDEKFIITHAGSFVYIWEITSDVETLMHNDRIISAQLSQNGKYVATASADSTARIWDAQTGKPIIKPLRHCGAVYSAVFSPPDGEYILTRSADSTARVWDAKTGKPITKPLKHGGTVRSAVFSPDGKYVATASDDETVRIWDAQTGEIVMELPGNDEVGFSPNGKYITTKSYLGDYIRIWNVMTGKSVIDPMRERFNAYVINNLNEKYFILESMDDSIVRILDTTTGKITAELSKFTNCIENAEFSPDGNCLYTYDSNTARVWDVRTGKLVTEMQLVNDDFSGGAFSPDGKYIASSGYDVTYVWNAMTGELVTGPLQHDDDVRGEIFSPDGKYVVTETSGNTICVWNTITGDLLKEWKSCNYLGFTPDGKSLVTTGNSIQTWPFPPLQELIDKYRKDPEHDWSLSQEEKDEYSLE